MGKRKLSRSQLRSLLLHEVRAITSKKRSSKKPLNEGILAGLAAGALVTFALAALTGIQYVLFESTVDDIIASDPRVKAKLAELEDLIKENPERHPADVAKMAAQKDQELAQIIQEIQAQAMQRASSAMSNTNLDV